MIKHIYGYFLKKNNKLLYLGRGNRDRVNTHEKKRDEIVKKY